MVFAGDSCLALESTAGSAEMSFHISLETADAGARVKLLIVRGAVSPRHLATSGCLFTRSTRDRISASR